MKTGKRALFLCSLLLIVSIFAGCADWTSYGADPVPGLNLKTEKFVCLSYAKYDEDFSRGDLGAIRTEGGFTYCSSNNMLKFRGYYRGLDFITLVFEKSSPINSGMLKRDADNRYSRSLQGMIFAQDSHHKFVTYQYETAIYDKNGEPSQAKTASANSFKFQVSDDEPETYYSINLRGYKGKYLNKDLEECDMVITHRVQTEVLPQSYWTDYGYDETQQFYHADKLKWNTRDFNDKRTNYMPLE